MKGSVTPLKEGPVVDRADSWMSAFTGLGNALRDKAKTFTFRRLNNRRLRDEDAEALYATDDMAAVLVDKLPEQMFRAGFRLRINDDNIDDAIALGDTVVSSIEDLGLIHAEFRAMIMSRIFGGGAAYHLIDDGRSQDKPVNRDGIRRILGAHVLDSRELRPETYYSDPSDPKFGEPELYRLLPHTTRSGGTLRTVMIHESRISAYHGIVTTRRRMMEGLNNGWGDSVLERSYDTLQSFNQAWAAVSHLMADSSQAVFKMKGLIQAIAMGKQKQLVERMELVDMSRSVARAVMLDEDESFERHPHNLTGLEGLLAQFSIRLAASVRLPVTLLMGQSPAGLNATGESDIRQFHEEVESKQKKELRPKLLRLIELQFHNQEGPTQGVPPEDWDIEFNPLRQMSELEWAELRKKQAETDAIYIREGVIIPEEAALSRFAPGGWSGDTTVDLELREQTLDAAKEQELERAENPPEPPPLPGGPQPSVPSDEESDPNEQPQTELPDPESGDDEEGEGQADDDENEEDE